MRKPLRVVIGGVEHTIEPTTDTDGSGRPDTATLVVNGHRYTCTDLDGDGRAEVIRLLRPDGSHAVLVFDDESKSYNQLSDSAAADDSVDEGASHWFAQATTTTCGPAAITMVLADLFDLRLGDERAVWQRAIDMAAIDDRGMRPGEIAEVVTSYGIPASLITADLDLLETMLCDGHEVILMVDAHDYWPGFEAHGEADVPRAMPHAVRLLAIDRGSGQAIVSDSGRSDPRFSRLTLPIEVLDDAWADLERLAVVTEVTADQVRRSLLDHGIDVEPLVRPPARRAEPGVRQRIVLPIALRLARLRAWLRRQ